MKRLLILVAMLAGCTAAGGPAIPPASVGPTLTLAPTVAPSTPVATEEPATPDPATPAPTPDGPTTYKAGETIHLTQDGDAWADVTVSKVQVVAKYDGAYSDDKPAKGHVFIQALVTYVATVNGVDYNPYDWQVFVAGEAVTDTTFVMYGPKTELSSGTLPAGRKASGYVVYEVPAKGDVRMSYGNMFGNDAPVFEVIIRNG
jgi:hypothetical protein